MSSEHLRRRLVKSLIGIKSKLRLSAEAHQHNLILLLLSVASLFSINHWSGVTDIWFEWSWWCPHVCMSKLLHSVVLRQLTRCGRKTKQTEQPRHWTQWPLSPLTRCGRKTKQPSCCAWWWLLSEQPNGIQRTKPCIIVLPIQCWIIVLPIQCWIIVLPLNLARADSQQNVLWDTALHFSLRTTSINNIYCGRLSLYLLSMIEIYMLALSWWKYCKNSPNGWYFVFFFSHLTRTVWGDCCAHRRLGQSWLIWWLLDNSATGILMSSSHQDWQQNHAVGAGTPAQV